MNNNNFKAPGSYHNFNGNIVFLFSNNVPTNELVIITWTTLGNGSASVVLVSISLSSEGLSISA